MSFKSILVYRPIENAHDSTISIAVEIARRFEAKLIGIAACDFKRAGYPDSPDIKKRRSQVENALKQAARQFRLRVGKNVGVEWRQAIARPTSYVARQARAADLVVTDALRQDYFDSFAELDPGQLIMESGRPVLIVPPETKSLSAKHVLIAWKDTREARRAVLDALPFLQAAVDVTVVEIVEAAKEKSAKASCEDVVAWLTRHNVCATAHTVISDYDSFGAFDGLLLQNAADLIVAGAYGHSRLQEWIFGGVTRDLLMKARCCCLFSN